jgi:competence protein ComEC
VKKDWLISRFRAHKAVKTAPDPMVDLSRAPVTRVLFPFAAGSLSGYLLTCEIRPDFLLYGALPACVSAAALLLLPGKKTVWRKAFFSLLTFFVFLWSGFGVGVCDRPREPELPRDSRIVVMGRVLEEPRERSGRISFDMQLSRVCGREGARCTRTIVMASMAMPRDSVLPHPGDTWILAGRLAEIRNSGNPGETDYASILHRRNCWFRFYAETLQGVNMKVEESCGNRLSAAGLRESLMQHWEGPPEELALVRALCLGDRSVMPDELLRSYSMAGGMHLLAVSGLHVGLVWWVLNALFSFLPRWTGKECWRSVPVIALLWFYAWLTGFSSSVSRAVTMFSLFSVSRLIFRRSLPVNVILLSMFIQVVIRPGWLLEPGFQLSYAAVLAIVTLYPRIRNAVRVKNRILRKVWEASTVSLAAQAGTVPLVIHYFHQVPVYGLVTNLLALPLLSMILTVFLLSLPFVAAGEGTWLFNFLLMRLAAWLNGAMEAVASIPGAVVTDLHMDPLCIFLLMVILFLGVTALDGKRKPALLSALFVLSILLIRSTQLELSRSATDQLVIAHFRNGSLVTFREGRKVDHYIWCSDPSVVASMDRYLAGTWNRRNFEVSVITVNNAGSGEEPACTVSGGISCCSRIGPGTWLAGNRERKGLVIIGTGNEGLSVIPFISGLDFVLLSGEPPLTPAAADRLFKGPWQVVADGSCGARYRSLLRAPPERIHDTHSRGAFMMLL